MASIPEGILKGSLLAGPWPAKKNPTPVSWLAGSVKKINTCLLAPGAVKKSTPVSWPASVGSTETSVGLFFAKNPADLFLAETLEPWRDTMSKIPGHSNRVQKQAFQQKVRLSISKVLK